MPAAAAETLNDTQLRRRMLGCWLGKAVGGTLGMPYEGVRHRMTLSFYEPVPREMLPNDDLDLQVVYAYLLDRMGDAPQVDRHVLSQAWQHVGMSPDEYGVCKRNLRLGLRPPYTGSYDNWFVDGMGAAIRTELWACLAAGDPKRAAQYAYEDACMDHAGEGIYAAQFLAALQAQAFIDSDPDTLIDTALAVIPESSAIAQGITLTRQWWRELHDIDAVFHRIHHRFGSDNFTDVKLNLPFIVLGWLASEGDFSRGICEAVNCGQDTDCTGATLGALMGLLDPDGIESRWLEPIGRDLVLSPCITGITHPPTIDGFTDLVLDLRRRLIPHVPTHQDTAPDLAKLAVRVKLGSASWAEHEKQVYTPAFHSLHDHTMPGTLGRVEPDTLRKLGKGDALVVSYRLNIDTPQAVRLVFNTAQPVRVWLGRHQVLSRDGKSMCPAFHRAPDQQWTVLPMHKGEHLLTALIQHPAQAQPIEWAVGLADTPRNPVDADWLIDPFERVG